MIEDQIKEIRQVGFNLLSIKTAMTLINHKYDDSDLEGLIVNIEEQVNKISTVLNGEQ